MWETIEKALNQFLKSLRKSLSTRFRSGYFFKKTSGSISFCPIESSIKNSKPSWDSQKICNIAKNQSHFMKLLINKIKDYIKLFKPSCLAIFTDGQAILAKANTQIKFLFEIFKTPSVAEITDDCSFIWVP